MPKAAQPSVDDVRRALGLCADQIASAEERARWANARADRWRLEQVGPGVSRCPRDLDLDSQRYGLGFGQIGR